MGQPARRARRVNLPQQRRLPVRRPSSKVCSWPVVPLRAPKANAALNEDCGSHPCPSRRPRRAAASPLHLPRRSTGPRSPSTAPRRQSREVDSALRQRDGHNLDCGASAGGSSRHDRPATSVYGGGHGRRDLVAADGQPRWRAACRAGRCGVAAARGRVRPTRCTRSSSAPSLASACRTANPTTVDHPPSSSVPARPTRAAGTVPALPHSSTARSQWRHFCLRLTAAASVSGTATAPIHVSEHCGASPPRPHRKSAACRPERLSDAEARRRSLAARGEGASRGCARRPSRRPSWIAIRGSQPADPRWAGG